MAEIKSYLRVIMDVPSAAAFLPCTLADTTDDIGLLTSYAPVIDAKLEALWTLLLVRGQCKLQDYKCWLSSNDAQITGSANTSVISTLILHLRHYNVPRRISVPLSRGALMTPKTFIQSS